jgi:predicted enzyme related to lactoylglutathione lyase
MPDNSRNDPVNNIDMKNRLSHFAIHVDGIGRAKSFYDGVFAWEVNSYEQPDLCNAIQ